MLTSLRKKKFVLNGNTIAWILLLSLLLYSTALLYTTEVYYIDSTVKASTITIELVNVTVNNNNASLMVSFIIRNPQTPNLSIILFLFGVGVYTEGMSYLGSNSSYPNTELLAGNSYSVNMNVSVRHVTSPIVISARLVFRVQTNIEQIKTVSIYRQFIATL